MSAFNLPVVFRKAVETDLSMIHDAWAKTLKDSAPYRYMESKAAYFKGMHREIDKVLAVSEAFVLCAEDDPSQLYSFAVTQQLGDVLVIHFAYTKSTYWRFGLMKRLLTEIEPDVFSTGAVYTANAPCLIHREWYVGDKPFIAYLKDAYGFVFNPFAKVQA